MLTFDDFDSYVYLCLYVVVMRDNAIQWLTSIYNADYAPENASENPTTVEKGPPPKVRKLASDIFLDDDDEEMEEKKNVEMMRF